MFDIMLGILVPFGMVALYVVMFRYTARRATFQGLMEIIDLARGFLVVAYVFVVAGIAATHLLGFDVGVGRSLLNLLLLLFVALPAFFAFCYLQFAIQMNIMINLMLARYYKENKTATDKQVSLRVRKMMRKWSLLHRFLFVFRKVTIAEAVEQVCFVGEDGK